MATWEHLAYLHSFLGRAFFQQFLYTHMPVNYKAQTIVNRMNKIPGKPTCLNNVSKKQFTIFEKLTFLRNLKIVFNQNKIFIWAHSFANKGLLKPFSFLRNRSVKLNNFMVKLKILKENLYFTENRLSRNEIWFVVVNDNVCVAYAQRDI